MSSVGSDFRESSDREAEKSPLLFPVVGQALAQFQKPGRRQLDRLAAGEDRLALRELIGAEMLRPFVLDFKFVIHHGCILSTSRRLSLSESWLALAGCRCFRFGGDNQTLANSSLAGELASAANSFRFLPHFSFRRLFIGGPELHLSEYSLALHFFLQEFQRLVDVIVADCNEQNISNLALANRRCGTRSRHATPKVAKLWPP